MTQQQAEFEIHGLQQALSEWRSSHRAPVPIPAEIWSGAVRTAAVLGVGPVAKMLKVDYAKLKKLLVRDTPVKAARGRQITTTFLEVSTQSLQQTLSCSLEVTREGATLRAQLEGVAPAEVGALLREFAR